MYYNIFLIYLFKIEPPMGSQVPRDHRPSVLEYAPYGNLRRVKNVGKR